MTKCILRVINLGRLGYQRALDVQEQCATNHTEWMRQDGHSPSCDTLILVEHDPVYTVGIRGNGYSEETAERLQALGAEYYHTNRGGLITFHGHGQLVAYPIINLTHYTPSLRWYIGALERVLIHTCALMNVKAKVTQDVGVWVDNRKIAAIGVHAKRHITTHGISLNCNVDLAWYNHIVACGLHGKAVTSLSKELSKEVTISDIIKPFTYSFCNTFECTIGEWNDVSKNDNRNVTNIKGT